MPLLRNPSSVCPNTRGTVHGGCGPDTSGVGGVSCGVGVASVKSTEFCQVYCEWREKYEILMESHRKVQKTNEILEDKLLKLVDKFDLDKNQITRDLASQTQKLVEAKLKLASLKEENKDLSADLHLSITLLQNRPSCFMAQRIESLPSDVQIRVKNYLAENNGNGCAVGSNNSGGGGGGSGGMRGKGDIPAAGKRITVEVIQDDDNVSAAILAKVLEERDKERRKENKFCIDVGTQTHGWQFPDKIYSKNNIKQKNTQKKKKKEEDTPPPPQPPPSSSAATAVAPAQTEDQHPNISDDTKLIHVLRSISADDQQTTDIPSAKSPSARNPRVSNILLTSVIQRPPPHKETPSYSSIESSDNDDEDNRIIRTTTMHRSSTYSAMQTDL